MNDEFLYRLRAEPPPGFAARLRRRFERTPAGNVTRARMMRTFIAGLLIGASALAVMSPGVRERAAGFVQDLRAPDDSERQAANESPDEARRQAGGAAQGYWPSGRATAGQSSGGQRPRADERVSGSAPEGATAFSKSTPVAPAGARVSAPTASSPDVVRVIGSPIVYPFTRQVADRYTSYSRRKVFIESTSDTSEGFALFCDRSNPAQVVQAGRRINAREVQACADRGFRELYEVKLGRRAYVLVSGLGTVPIRLTRRELYLALSYWIPDPLHARRTIENPHRTWQDVNPRLPALNIEVLGPPLVLEKADEIAEFVLAPWCDSDREVRLLRALERAGESKVCSKIRDDGAYLASNEDYPALLERLSLNPNLVALVGYGFLDAHRARLVEVPLEGTFAQRDTIASGAYPLSRTLYLYFTGSARERHSPAKRFAEEYLGDDALGSERHFIGYLVQSGLIPLDELERSRVRADPFTVNVIDAR